MILSFTTRINGKETFFVEKIQTALKLPFFKDAVAFSSEYVPPNMNFYVKSKCKPKLHTIREDKSNRWRKDINIDFYINARQPSMFRFAPTVKVISTQRIFMTYDNGLEISINGTQLNNIEIKQLAINDGFDSINDFDDYFEKAILANEDKAFSGKIIHWTDLRY